MANAVYQYTSVTNQYTTIFYLNFQKPKFPHFFDENDKNWGKFAENYRNLSKMCENMSKKLQNFFKNH